MEQRKINTMTVKVVYQVLRMDECLVRIFLTLDPNSGYWKIEIDDCDKENRRVYGTMGCTDF